MKHAWLILALALISCGTPRQPLPVLGSVPDFALVSETGQEFRGQSLRGKIWAADFFFTSCPGPCPRMAVKMHQVQEATRDLPDVGIVSFSVDPSTDTPAVLAAYAHRNRADGSRWHFLTGPRATLHDLSRNVFKLSDVDGSLVHSTRFVLVDREGRIRGYYGTEDDDDGVKRLIADIRRLAKERA